MGNIAIRELVTADPVAGQEINFVADDDMIIHSLRFVLVSSAVVGVRNITLTADDNGANAFWQSQSVFNQAASSTVTYIAMEGIPAVTTSALTQIALPSGGLRLRKGDRLRTNGIFDAGDNYTSAVIQAERVDA